MVNNIDGKRGKDMRGVLFTLAAYLLAAVVAAALVAAEILDDKTEVTDHGSYYLLTSHTEPAYFVNDAGEWEDINTNFVDDTGAYDFKVDKLKDKIKTKKKPSSNDIFRVQGDGYELILKPVAVGYVNKDGLEEIKTVPSNINGYAQGNKVKFGNFFGGGINFTFQVTPTKLIKTIVLESYYTLPQPSEAIISEECAANCTYTQVYGFIDNKISGSAMEIHVDGQPWNGEDKLTTLVEFKHEGETVYRIDPGYILGNGSKFDTEYKLYADAQNIYIRQLIEYDFLRDPAYYPMVIDPTITIDNSTPNASYDGTSCTPVGNCCITGVGQCNEPLGGLCIHGAVVSSGIKIDTSSCTACGTSPLTCCRFRGSLGYQNLIYFNWSDTLTNASLNYTIHNAIVKTGFSGVLNTRHVNLTHWDNLTDWPDCDYNDAGPNDDHKRDEYDNPAAQNFAKNLNWNFTDHVQVEVNHVRDHIALFLDSQDNTATSRNIFVNANITINYTATPYPPEPPAPDEDDEPAGLSDRDRRDDRRDNKKFMSIVYIIAATITIILLAFAGGG